MLPPDDGTQHLSTGCREKPKFQKIIVGSVDQISPQYILFGWSKDKGIQNILKLQRLSTANLVCKNIRPWTKIVLCIPAFEIQTFQVSIPAAYPSCDSLAVSCLIFLVSTTICQLSPVCRVPLAIIQMTSWSAASDDGGIFDNGSKRHIYYLPPGPLYAVVSSDIPHTKRGDIFITRLYFSKPCIIRSGKGYHRRAWKHGVVAADCSKASRELIKDCSNAF